MTRETLQKAAMAVTAELPDVGFILLTVPFGATPETTNAQYISNCDRDDAVKILKVLLFRWGKEEAWMKDV